MSDYENDTNAASIHDGFAEASEMLSSALAQLDGIIAGSVNVKPEVLYEADGDEGCWEACNGTGAAVSSDSSVDRSPPSDVAALDADVGSLVGRLLQLLRRDVHSPPPPPADHDSILTLLKWLMPSADVKLSPSPSMSTVSCPEYGELQDRLQRLAVDRESLSLQVSVLSEQVGAQTDKIRDLESLLQDRRQRLDSTEDMLHDEVVTRTNLETSKLDLMAEMSTLKLSVATLERDKIETEHRYRLAQAEITHLQKLAQSMSPSYGAPAEVGHHQRSHTTAFDHTGEIDQLRQAVNSLMIANTQKDVQIEQLRQAVVQTQFIRGADGAMSTGIPRSISGYDQSPSMNDDSTQFDINAQLRKLLNDAPSHTLANSSSFSDDPRSDTFRIQPASGAQGSPSYSSSLSAFSTGSPAWSACVQSRPPQPSQQLLAPPPSRAPPMEQPDVLPPTSRAAHSPGRQLAAELDELRPVPPPAPSSFYSTASLPRNLPGKRTLSAVNLPSAARKKSGSTAGGEWRPPRPPLRERGLKWLRRTLRPSGAGKRSTSAPNLAESDDETLHSARTFNSRLRRNRNHSSFRNLLGKLRRSSSQELMEAPPPFERGVLTRATAAPRVPTGVPSARLPGRPPMDLFVQWDCGQVCDWLISVGLGAYADGARAFVQSGRHMLTITPSEIEKNLQIRNPLHQKKLKILTFAIQEGRTEAYDRMDCHQVLRWLDDIGLPQFRDSFADALVDGQMLVALTVDDLLHLRIQSALHHAALARGVQLLRSVGFNLNRLQRKFSADVAAEHVQLWTQHCVSDWLRTVDLTEFTPNLMCAGISGSLMVLEPTFTAESLADVLQIAASKTLLRRHLATHFNELVGGDVIASKRDALMQTYAAPLSPDMKIKLVRKGLSLPRKRNRAEVYAESGELVCSFNVCRRRTGLSTSQPDVLPKISLEKMTASDV